ncbi:MAG: RteC domain-containing protein [Draconibacterium sp.]
MSFLTVALEWTRDNRQFRSVTQSADTNSKPKPDFEPPAPKYIWGGTITDLIEIAIAVCNIKLIRKASGKLITFAEIIRVLKLVFDIKIPKNIYSRKTRTMERKKNPSSMLDRLLAVYNHELERLYT